MKFPYVFSFLVWRKRDESDNRIPQIEEYLRSEGFSIKEDGHPIYTGISNKNPRFQDALKALGEEHQVEYRTECEKNDTLALSLLVSPKDDASYEMAIDEWKGLKEKYESVIDSIRKSLESGSPIKNDKIGESLLDADFEHKIISIAGFEDKAKCIKFSEEDVKHKCGLSHIWQLKIYGDSLFNESSLFIEIRNIPKLPYCPATDVSVSGAAKASRIVPGMGYFLQLRDDNSSKDRIVIFGREFLSLSRSLAKLDNWGVAVDDIHKELEHQEKIIQAKLKNLRDEIREIDIGACQIDKLISSKKPRAFASNRRLRILERKKTKLLSTIEELSVSVDECSRIEKSATNDILNIGKNMNDFEMRLKTLNARRTPELPSLSEIWALRYSGIRSAYDSFRHQINRTEKEVRDLHERAHLLLEDAQFELESARNRLLGLVTLYLEALIATSIIIPMYESSFDANTRILVTIIVLAFLVPIGLFIAFNVFRSARRNARK